MPSFSHTLQVAAAPDAVYAIIDDTEHARVAEPVHGDRQPGRRPERGRHPLRYHYKDGRRTGEMDGRITTHEAGGSR